MLFHLKSILLISPHSGIKFYSQNYITKNTRSLNVKKFFILFSLIMGLMFSPSFAKEWKEIRIATEGAYPPFNSIDSNGNLTGFDVDLIKAMCEEAGVTCKVVSQDWDGIIPGLLAKKYDAIIAGMTITDERKKQVSFSNPYATAWPRFVAPKDKAEEMYAEDFKGRKIGVQRATIFANFLEDKYADKVEVALYDSQENANLDLENGRIDAVLSDNLVIEEFLKSDSGQAFQFIGPELKFPKWFGEGLGIAVRQDDTSLLELLNNSLNAVVKNGKHKEIADKYFSRDVYDYSN